jgi:uncharacterized protein
MNAPLALAGLMFALAVAAPPVRAQSVEVPYLTGRVMDHAEILRPETRRRLGEQLREHERKTTNQVVVLTVPTLRGESVETYALRVFEQWQLGQKGKDNGVLVLVVPQERRMRIEVGYGLEGTLTDAAAARIIRNVMTPRFKQGDFDGGIAQGVSAILGQLEGRPQDAAGGDDAQARPASGGRQELMPAPDMAPHEKVLFGAFIFGIIGLFTFIGIVTPGMGWFLYFFLIPFWAMFPIVIFGSQVTFYILMAYLFGFPAAKLLVSRSETYRRATEDLKKKGRASIGGFTVGGGGSSWSSGRSWSSGGGFSGGGGRSGGGGSSGSW